MLRDLFCETLSSGCGGFIYETFYCLKDSGEPFVDTGGWGGVGDCPFVKCEDLLYGLIGVLVLKKKREKIKHWGKGVCLCDIRSFCTG